MAAKKVVRRGKKRVKKNIEKGQAHIRSTFNNTIVTLTDVAGNALAWSSAGELGFKGFKKKVLHMLLNQLQQKLLKELWNMV